MVVQLQIRTGMVLVPNLATMFSARINKDGRNLWTRNDVSVEGARSAMESTTNMQDEQSSCVPVTNTHDGSIQSEDLKVRWTRFNTLK